MKNIYIVASDDQCGELEDISIRFKLLKNLGYRIFESRRLSPGEIVTDSLQREFFNADILVYLVSPRLFTSNWVWQNEIQVLPIDTKHIVLVDYGDNGWQNTKLFQYRDNMVSPDNVVQKILSL